MRKISTFLTFDNQAEEAVRLYTSVFDGKILSMSGPPGKVFSLTFELFGQTFNAMNAGPSFKFGNGISLFVSCDTQAEIDAYWEKLTADGGAEDRCGWLTDKFGVTWQIIPRILPEVLGDKDPAKAGRAMQAMMTMKKLDIAALQRAHAGS